MYVHHALLLLPVSEKLHCVRFQLSARLLLYQASTASFRNNTSPKHFALLKAELWNRETSNRKHNTKTNSQSSHQPGLPPWIQPEKLICTLFLGTRRRKATTLQAPRTGFILRIDLCKELLARIHLQIPPTEPLTSLLCIPLSPELWQQREPNLPRPKSPYCTNEFRRG